MNRNLRCAICGLLCLVILVCTAGCSVPEIGIGASPEQNKEAERVAGEQKKEEEALAELARREQQELEQMMNDNYLVTDIDEEDERIILKSLRTNRQYRFAYGMGTQFLNKWNERTSQSEFVRGSIVKIGQVKNNMLSSLTLSKEAWIIDDLTNFSYDIGKEIFKVGKTAYRLRKTVSVFSGEQAIPMKRVTADDRLRVTGIDREVMSVVVTTGHGKISIVNTAFFNDSMISIGTRIYTRLNGDTTMRVPQGKYLVTVAKDGYGGSREYTVHKDETVTVDLNTLKGEGPKRCRFTLSTSIKGVKAFLDGKKIKLNAANEVAYGQHKLRVAVKGYEPWEKTLLVNSPEADISLDSKLQKTPGQENASNGKQGGKDGSGNTQGAGGASGGNTANNSNAANSSNAADNSNAGNAANSSNTGNGTNRRNTNSATSSSGTNTSDNTSNDTSGNSANSSSGLSGSGNAVQDTPASENSTGRTDAGTNGDGTDSGTTENSPRQAELDYLDTLSTMMDELMGND